MVAGGAVQNMDQFRWSPTVVNGSCKYMLIEIYMARKYHFTYRKT
jgi:hypothetical protein